MTIPQISAILGAIFKGFMYVAALFVAIFYLVMLVCVCREMSEKVRMPKGWEKEKEELRERVEAQLAQRRRK